MLNYAGNTPLAEITYKYKGSIGKVYAKLEYYNPSGSIKDRVVSYIMNEAERKGVLLPGQPIVETTSGNTGIALAAYGALTKHPVYIYMPSWVSEERIKLMRMYGANVTLISKEEGGFIEALKRTDEFVKEEKAFRLNQFSNTDNALAHYNGTGLELSKELDGITDFVSGVGSGGTIMGTGRRLKESFGTNLIAIEPDCAQTLAGKPATRQHKIEGIGDDFIPDIVDTKLIKNILPINDDDAIAMSVKLAKELGLGVGISSGANLIGAILSNGENKRIATVFSDDNKKYLSTSLANSPAPLDGMVSHDVELLEYVRV